MSELGGSFDLQKALRFGLLPTLYDEDQAVEDGDYINGYVTTYLKEEVAQEGLTRNLGAFARFWETAALSQGQPLNISAVARECQINRKLAENYFHILVDLLIGVKLPAFQKRAKRRIMQQPKFYLFDVGVFNALRPRGPLDPVEELEGAALETLVLQQLRAIMAQRESKGTLSYWRTSTGLEVDFVVYDEECFTALEVKRKRHIVTSDLNGLKAFGMDYPEAQRLLLYGGEHEAVVAGVRLMPLEKALERLEELVFGGQR